MKHHLPPLDSLKAFECAARHLSFSRAAEELCISKGAMSYQIRKLEEQVQCTLFKRSVRQVYLTDAGQSLLQTTKSIFKELDETLMRLHDESRHASVSIAATTYVAARWLSPRISAFNELHPSVDINYLHSVNSADFKLADVDLAIHWEPVCDQSDATQFDQIPMQMFPVIAPELLNKHGLSLTQKINLDSLLTGPLSQIPLLCEDRHLDLWDEWTRAALPNANRQLANPRRIISDANVRVQAAIDGQGFILADGLMSNEINNSLLVKPFANVLNGYGYALKSSHLLGKNAQLLKQWFTSNSSAST